MSNLIEFIPIQDHLTQHGNVAALGVGIGFVGSFFTIRRHLKVKTLLAAAVENGGSEILVKG